MKPRIVQSREIVALVGAGPMAEGALHESIRRSALVVAADGGAAVALVSGILPDAVIGDFDSIAAEDLAKIPADRLHPSADQDTTDFEKALAAIQAPLVLAVGFTGRRLDHELAAYNALVRAQESTVLILGEEDICFALNKPLTLEVEIGTRVSLFPMAEVRCASTGLRWATDHLTFAPWGRVGTSNEAASRRVTLTPGGPGMLVIVPRACLDAAIAGLRSGG